MPCKQRLPDRKLVYVQCSSIFRGKRAELRKRSTIYSALKASEASITALTKTFALIDVAEVAQGLLKERIFESLDLAKIQFPELFQASSAKVAKTPESGVKAIRAMTKIAPKLQAIRMEAKKVSDVEIVRVEPKPSRDTSKASSNKQGSIDANSVQCLDGEKRQGLVEVPQQEINAAPGTRPKSADHPWQVNPCRRHCHLADFPSTQRPISPVSYSDYAPRFDPVYLPFKTQHQILVAVQRLLEECCLEFGNVWVPNLMKAHGWNEVESIELTEWAKIVSKHAKDLPPAAIRGVSQNGFKEILLGVSSLRNSAVHRSPSSAPGISGMLSAALNFANALGCFDRAEKIADLRAELEACTVNIKTQQTLLEHKLSVQTEQFARQRAEIARLEYSMIEEALGRDKSQRAEAGVIMEEFLATWHQDLISPTSHQTRGWDRANVGSIAGNGCVPLSPVEMEFYDRDYPGKEKSRRRIAFQHASTSSYDSEVMDWENFEIEEDIHHTGNRVGEPTSTAATENYYSRTLQASPQDDAIFQKDIRDGEVYRDSAMLHDPCNLTVQSFDATIEKVSNNDKSPSSSTVSFSTAREYTAIGSSAERIFCFDPPARPPFGPVNTKLNSPSCPQSTLRSTAASNNAALTRDTAAGGGHNIMLKFLSGNKAYRCVISMVNCTRRAILHEAQVYCASLAQFGKVFGDLCTKEWHLALISVRMNVSSIDLSVYSFDDLSYLTRTVGRTDVPMFTLRIIRDLKKDA